MATTVLAVHAPCPSGNRISVSIMKPHALVFLMTLATPLAAFADIQIQCSPAPPPPPPPSRFDCLFPKGVTLRGREANWTHGYIGRLVLRGVRSYSATGKVPNTDVWKYLRRQHNLHPVAFNATHPYFQGLFEEPDVIGRLPKGKFWDKLENQFDNQPSQFDRCYPYLNDVMERDRLASHVTPGPNPQPPGPVGPPNPEPPGPVGPPVIVPPGPVGPPPPPDGPSNPPDRPSGGGPGFQGVPEPASIVLTASGLGALALIAARNRRRSARA